MPNPHPVHRPRTPRPEILPEGVRRRPDGRLERRYRDANGDRRSFQGRLGESLDAFLARGAGDVASIPVNQDGRLRLGAYLEGWLERLELRPNSIATHRGNVTRYLVPELGGVLLVDLDRPTGRGLIADAYRRLRARPGRPLAPRTIELAHATLRRALAQAVDDGMMRTNPALRVNVHGTTGRAAGARAVLAIPTAAELRALDEHLAGHPWHPIFRTAVLAGLRQSETLGLRWSPDLDELESRHLLTVNGALRRHDTTLDDPKSAAGHRTIKVDAMLVDTLRAHRQAQRIRRVAAGRRWAKDDQGLVFTTRTGTPLQGRLVTRWMQAAAAELGLPRYRWHDLRHAWVSGLLEHGVPVSTVSKLAGHASIAVTVDTYGHLTDEGRELVAIASGRALAR